MTRDRRYHQFVMGCLSSERIQRREDIFMKRKKLAALIGILGALGLPAANGRVQVPKSDVPKLGQASVKDAIAAMTLEEKLLQG
jgi:hypothetical protein